MLGKNSDKNIWYNQEEARNRLASIAQILMPLIRKCEANGVSWEAIQQGIVSTKDELVCLALSELTILDRASERWLANDQVLSYAELSYDEVALLSNLVVSYLVEVARVCEITGK